MIFLQVRRAKDAEEWNGIVDKSPYSVLHHKYELYTSDENALPLILEERNHHFLFPLRTVQLFRSFRLATSEIHSHVSIIPDTEEALDLVPKVLDHLSDFLLEIQVDYLSTCAPTFLSRRYAKLLTDWFVKEKASVQVIYAHMIPTENTTFEDIWRHKVTKRTREYVRKARREGVEVLKIDTVNGIRTWMEDIHQCNVSALRRQGRWGAYPDSYKEVFLPELVSAKERLKQHFNIYGALYRGRLIAYMVFQEYKKLISLSKAASRTESLGKHPNDVLIAHVLKEACERKFHWLEYTFDRVRRDGKIPSLYPGLQGFKRKFGFEEVHIPIYRLGLTRKGRIIQRLYSGREYLVTRSAYIPKAARAFFLRLYAPRRRGMTPFLQV